MHQKIRCFLRFFDGIGMGLGFTVGLTAIGIVRELLGAGEVFGIRVMPQSYEPLTILFLPRVRFCIGMSCSSPE